MPKYKVKASKVVYYETVVEGENMTDALLKVNEADYIFRQADKSEDLQILGDAKEIE